MSTVNISLADKGVGLDITMADFILITVTYS
jgi:hypothetical protein